GATVLEENLVAAPAVDSAVVSVSGSPTQCLTGLHFPDGPTLASLRGLSLTQGVTITLKEGESLEQ
ncbi:hypothetical protein P7K49_033973, partial [Saguinus oedipus]